MRLYVFAVFIVIIGAVQARRPKQVNVATGKAIQGRGRIDLRNAVDGDKTTCSDTQLLTKPLITIDLQQTYQLSRIKLYLTNQLVTAGVAKIRVGNSTTTNENPICARLKQRHDGVVIASKCTGIGRYIIVQKVRDWGNVALCEIEAMTPACDFPVPLKNVANGKHIIESSDKNARDLEDIDFDGGNFFFRGGRIYQPSWKIDLASVHDVYQVALLNREECGYYPIMNSEIRVGNDETSENNAICNEVITRKLGKRERVTFQCGCQTPLKGRYVSGMLLELVPKMLHICAIQVMAG